MAALFNKVYPIYCKRTKPEYGLNKTERKEKIVISMTSFPARLNVVHYAVRALLQQSYKPDRIILWLTEEECHDITIPKELEDLKQYGLEIKYAPANLRPHNKLYFTLKECPDCVVISVDDDNVYSTKLVEGLFKAHQVHPEAVCCNMSHEILLKNGKPDLYDNWYGGADGRDGLSNYYVALGVGGVLYPPNCFDDEYFDQKLIRELALSADDLWLKITEIRLGIPVFKISKDSKIPYVIGGTQKVTLGKENNGMKKNDINMKKLCEHYSIDWENL